MLERSRRRWTSARARSAAVLRRPPAGQPLAALPWMLAAAAAAAGTIWITTAWLLGTADAAHPGTDRARVRVEAVRTGLAAGAGAGAAIALLLAFRRQAHQEYDTAERRVTELYNAAAEQLGSDKAPVRLTALYTLERLANTNAAHRQTIVNIICSYLRMPYTPPLSLPNQEAHQRTAVRRYHAARTRSVAAPEPPLAADPHEERQVRLTAQRILHAHLQPAAVVPWTGLSLDLTGATLINFTLSNCTLNTADFSGATFAEGASFTLVTFSGDADFTRATFLPFPGPAQFTLATFAKGAAFGGTTFARNADFQRATFSEGAGFDRATFSGNAGFSGVTFSRNVGADKPASFTYVIEGVDGGRITSSGDAFFYEATFSDTADFSGVTFSGEAWFYQATFSRDANFSQVTFSRTARFDEAVFEAEPTMAGAKVADAARLDHVLPPEWRIEPVHGGGEIVPKPNSQVQA
ncbi:hypothetical protein GCM10010411_75690 [Actinomadura fulvescens]|uniref:Pentapeptide repeat-containing protein n=1 Tax=Actinomadura fulvescens TaxID=46160 RepID=A0ABP6CXE3_9ACTN